jgi:hypothetical protein
MRGVSQCRWGRQELFDRGASVHEVDAEPWATPMAWAKRMNHVHILSLLQAGSGHESLDDER